MASFLSPDDSDRREAAIAKRLDRIVRVLERLERNDGITLETIALFIRFWLTSTPALPEQSSPAARAKGAERYDRSRARPLREWRMRCAPFSRGRPHHSYRK